MTVTLYDCPTAPSPRRARMLLAEKGIAHETVNVDLAKGEQLSDAFRAINPSCTVPALKLEDGTIIPDNDGIAAWAEAVKPMPALLGTSPVETGMVWSWNTDIQINGFMACAERLRNSAPGMKGRALPGPVNHEQIPALAERGTVRIGLMMEKLDRHLAGRDFMVGNSISLADITALIFVDFASRMKCGPSDEMSDLKRWHAAMAERPSAKL